MENMKQGTAVLIQDERASITLLKTRKENPVPERRQSDPSQEHTPERPQSSLKYNTPMTPEYASRPRAVSYGYKGSISSDDELRPEDDSPPSPPSAPGPGAVTGVPIYMQRRTSFQRPAPPGRKRTHTPRLPSWHSTSKGAVNTITSSLNLISNFMRTVDCSPNTDSTNFRLFLDANKEIVGAWRGLEDEEIKGNPVLGEKVDCMHAILAAWSIDFGREDKQGRWLLQAIELAELNREFAEVWETVVGVEIEQIGRVEQGQVEEKEKDIFTYRSELGADKESNVEAIKVESKVEAIEVETIKIETVKADVVQVEECKIEEKEGILKSPIKLAPDEESRFAKAEDISTSQSEPATDIKIEEQPGIPSPLTEPTTDQEPVSLETMEFIHPDYCAPLFRTKDCVEGGINSPTVDSRPLPSKDGDDCSIAGSNSPKVSNEHNTVSSAILERLEKIETLLSQQVHHDVSSTLEKIDNLTESIVERSATQAKTADQNRESMERHIDQATAQAAENIALTIKERFDKIESELFQQKQQSSAEQKETFKTIIDQQFGKVETRFDSIQDSINDLSAQQSTTATEPSFDNLEKLNEGISITDRGTMIQQVHSTIFRDWQALSLDQKRSAISLMKKLISDWQEKYRVKMALIDTVVADLPGMSPKTAEKVAARTTEIKESTEKSKIEIDLVEECTRLYDEIVTREEALKSRVALIGAKQEALKQAMMNSHWVYTALDEAVDFCWPQGNADSSTDTDTDSELECEEGGLGNQLGRSGGSGGGCVIM